MKRRTPQEKKLLSYAKDRRNDYGENDKSSRKNIRRNKKAPHRANRHHAAQVLEAAKGAVDDFAESAVEERLLRKRPKSWQKYRDAPLGEILQYKIARRVDLGIEDPEEGRVRIERVRRRLRPAVDYVSPQELLG
ncbi:hypothetical protein ABGB17_23935 [Sphaerisporangium sp. B11E5]|uniref:hypothetical protein n=1 Tax=Sphaerisporangium sp. B11E5 TaxID=3153563 RepID=UPI00325EE3A1